MKTTSRGTEAGNKTWPKAFFSYYRHIPHLLTPATSASLSLAHGTNHKYSADKETEHTSFFKLIN